MRCAASFCRRCKGAAVTSIKIENVLHEFSSLAGVRERDGYPYSNVKQIALKMQGEGPKRLQLSATGPAEVKAGDIAVSGDIQSDEPGSDPVSSRRWCDVEHGTDGGHRLGYVPATANRPADAPIGLIPVDALYSPVRQVSYKVENTRVGQELDYDKLTLTIDTDGTVTPKTRWPMLVVFCRTSWRCSSTSTIRQSRGRRHRLPA